MSITNLAPIKVLCTKALVKDTNQIGVISGKLFHDLESRLPKVDGKPELKGRKMYGTYHNGEYRACFAIQENDDAKLMKLEEWEIPGGKYAKATINDWPKNTAKIGSTFDELSKRYNPDLSRPLIEFYRSHKELVLFYPVK